MAQADIKLAGVLLTLEGNTVKLAAPDLQIDHQPRRVSQTGSRRALVHGFNDKLVINFNKDYPGGVTIRGDVYVPNKGKPIAFEIQLSPQSLARTLERQEKYIRDGVIGCWLFEKPVPKLIEERPDLPVFYVQGNEESDLIVNLGDRRKVDLQVFLQNFIANNIQFNTVARTKTQQTIKLVFY